MVARGQGSVLGHAFSRCDLHCHPHRPVAGPPVLERLVSLPLASLVSLPLASLNATASLIKMLESPSMPVGKKRKEERDGQARQRR